MTPGLAPAHAETVFFDAGFTLLEPVRSIAAIYAEAASDVGVEVPLDAMRRALAVADTEGARRADAPDHSSSEEIEREGWRKFTTRVAAEIPALAVARGAWTKLLFERFDAPESWRVAEGAHALLDALVASGKKVAVVSNWHGALRSIAEARGIARRVSALVVSSEIGFRKPDVRIFERALETLSADPRTTVHVGDSWSDDVVGARAAALTPIWLSGDAPPRDGVLSAATMKELLGVFGVNRA